MERITELLKDPSVKTYILTDANCALSESIREGYEFLYVKLVEATNVLVAKGANPESMTLDTPPYMGDMLVRNFVREPGRHYIGTCNNRWRVFQDSTLPLDQVVIGSDIGKAVVIVLNFPELTDGQPLDKMRVGFW